MAKGKSTPVDLSHVRNIGIAAHIDAGKTTLTERVLYYTGASHKIGEVHDGEARMDWMEEEQEHGITITAAVTKCPWKDHLIQIVDTPGHVDFTIEVERSMRVLDAAVIVMDGVRGVEPQTETVWRQANQFELPRMFFVNKMDRPGADYGRCLEAIRERLEGEPVPVCVPLSDDSIVHLVNRERYTFSGDMGEHVAVGEVDADTWASVAEHRESLLLAVADLDEELAEVILMEEEPDPDAVWAALKAGLAQNRINPCFAGSALRNWGVQPLLDGVLKLCPAPLDRPPSTATTSDGDEVLVEMDPDGPFAALAFKVQMMGGRRHVFARIYSGRLAPGDQLLVPRTGDKERVARVFDVDAARKSKLDSAYAGQIVLLAGLRKATTGDTLTSPDHPLLLEPIRAMNPVLGLAIEAGSSREEEKLLEALGKVLEEDPTLRLDEDAETGQRVLRGMGELHLQIVFERLQREYGVSARAGKPDVVVRESIAGPGRCDNLFHRVIDQGDASIELKARAVAEVEPRGRGEGMTFDVAPAILPAGTSVNAGMEEAIQAGARDGAICGPVEGAVLQDVAVAVLEVELFGPSSSVHAVRAAVAEAVRKAIVHAGGVAMRPIMATEVVVPEESFGTVLGDLQARGALIQDTVTAHGVATITCETPLQKLLGYTTNLRSMTQGRGQFSMEFSRFDAL